MTSYLNDQTYTQTFGEQNLTADPANPTVVFLNATSIVAFAGNGGVGTEYIVLGAVSQSPLLYKFDAFAPGDIVHFHIDFQGAVNYVINSSSNIVWTSGGPAWHGSDTTPID